MGNETSFKPVHELPQKLVRFAQLYAEGLSAMKAARLAGYKNTTANNAHRWIRRTRDESQYPFLYDYYDTLRKEKLRLFDINQDTLVHELKIIAFSNIENYLDLPSREVFKKVEKLEETYTVLLNELESYLTDEFRIAQEKEQPLRGILKYHAASKPVLAKLKKIEREIKEMKQGEGYYLRLKWKESIPPELMPAVAEIRQTREGIAVKLHSKMDALDKLARWQKMYDTNSGDEEGKLADIKTVQLVVSGSKSPLLNAQNKDAAA
jgi:hypothetical protein